MSMETVPFFLAAFVGAACGVFLPVAEQLGVILRAGAREAALQLFRSRTRKEPHLPTPLDSVN
jgi:hypothetical protein